MLKLRVLGSREELFRFASRNAPYIVKASAEYQTTKQGIYRRHYDMEITCTDASKPSVFNENTCPDTPCVL